MSPKSTPNLSNIFLAFPGSTINPAAKAAVPKLPFFTSFAICPTSTTSPTPGSHAATS